MCRRGQQGQAVEAAPVSGGNRLKMGLLDKEEKGNEDMERTLARGFYIMLLAVALGIAFSGDARTASEITMEPGQYSSPALNTPPAPMSPSRAESVPADGAVGERSTDLTAGISLIPEPAPIVILGVGTAAVIIYRRRR